MVKVIIDEVFRKLLTMVVNGLKNKLKKLQWKRDVLSQLGSNRIETIVIGRDIQEKIGLTTIGHMIGGILFLPDQVQTRTAEDEIISEDYGKLSIFNNVGALTVEILTLPDQVQTRAEDKVLVAGAPMFRKLKEEADLNLWPQIHLHGVIKLPGNTIEPLGIDVPGIARNLINGWLHINNLERNLLIWT